MCLSSQPKSDGQTVHVGKWFHHLLPHSLRCKSSHILIATLVHHSGVNGFAVQLGTFIALFWCLVEVFRSKHLTSKHSTFDTSWCGWCNFNTSVITIVLLFIIICQKWWGMSSVWIILFLFQSVTSCVQRSAEPEGSFNFWQSGWIDSISLCVNGQLFTASAQLSDFKMGALLHSPVFKSHSEIVF